MSKVFLLALAMLLFDASDAFSQWVLVSTIPNQPIIALQGHQHAVYAATSSGVVYKSTDQGNSWLPMVVGNSSVAIYSLEFIDNNILVGTESNGIFQSADGGVTWQNTLSTALPITGFVKKGNSIYAGTLGDGVYVYGPVSNHWSAFNHSLPLNVAGSVNGIASSDNYLFIASGANGVFHKYNFASNNWEEGYYYGTILAGLAIDDLESRGDTITVVNGRRTIKSLNAGLSWFNDNVGARNGIDRRICNGAIDQYLTTNVVMGGSWVQKRNKDAALGADWGGDEEFVPNVYSYDILEFEDKLFLATETGLYRKDVALSVSDPIKPVVDLQVFPNPSNGREIQVRSSKTIVSYSVVNGLGMTVCNESIGSDHFFIEKKLPAGMYFVKFSTGNGVELVKKVIVQ
jgi:Secretion system C-terminal sorting domain